MLGQDEGKEWDTHHVSQPHRLLQTRGTVTNGFLCPGGGCWRQAGLGQGRVPCELQGLACTGVSSADSSLGCSFRPLPAASGTWTLPGSLWREGPGFRTWATGASAVLGTSECLPVEGTFPWASHAHRGVWGISDALRPPAAPGHRLALKPADTQVIKNPQKHFNLGPKGTFASVSLYDPGGHFRSCWNLSGASWARVQSPGPSTSGGSGPTSSSGSWVCLLLNGPV